MNSAWVSSWNAEFSVAAARREGVHCQYLNRSVSLKGNPWTIHTPMWGPGLPFRPLRNVVHLERAIMMHKLLDAIHFLIPAGERFPSHRMMHQLMHLCLCLGHTLPALEERTEPLSTFLNAVTWSSSYTVHFCMESRSQSALSFSAKWKINFPAWLTMLRKLLSSLTFVGSL